MRRTAATVVLGGLFGTLIFATGGPVGLAQDCARQIDQNSSGIDVLVCMGEMVEVLDERSQQLLDAEVLLRAALERLTSAEDQTGDALRRLDQSATELELLRTAILLIDTDQGCPTDLGWTTHEASMGRFVVGAGQGGGLTNRPFGEQGGEESVQLTPETMPAHNHPIRVSATEPQDDFLAGGGQPVAAGINRDFSSEDFDRQYSGVLGVTGGDQPHNNMPPYIALHFCEYVGVDGG